MFDKPILPDFLSFKKNEDTHAPKQNEAKPPMNPMMAHQTQAMTQNSSNQLGEQTTQATQQVAPSPQPVQQDEPTMQSVSQVKMPDQPSIPEEDPLAALRGKSTTQSPPQQTAAKVGSSDKKEHTFSNEADQITADATEVTGAGLHEVGFSDIWYTPEDIAYVRDPRTRFALIPIVTPDLPDFKRILEQGYTGTSSYSVKFAGDYYRVERIMTKEGVQYNCRKMPNEAPEIEQLGFAPEIVNHLASLGKSSGLLLFAGPTGQGKTTSASAIMKRYLETEGGFLYTIEDPPEMPLSGLYHAKNGGLGLCKQTSVENDQWGAGLRSALRSKPRYILVGEIRTPETAAQCLVAATSGHLVFSTIHANGVEDALNSMIKYASSTGLDSTLVADLLARGILGVIYQRLDGVEKLKLYYKTAFANPNTATADQMRMTIRSNNINLATYMEQQETLMKKGLPIFRD